MKDLDFKTWMFNYAKEEGFAEKVSSTNYFDPKASYIDQIIGAIDYRNDKPFDSFDRLFALYLIDQHIDVINKFDVDKACESLENGKAEYKKAFDTPKTSIDLKNEYEKILWPMSYENYEREGIDNICALVNMIHVAKKGKEAVLTDSYADEDGWFGAS